MQILSVGQLVGRSVGNFQIQRLIGQGKLATVYIAQQPEQDRTALITVFNLPEGICTQEREQFNIHFAKEGAALVKLIHPNIVPIYDFGQQFGHPYLATAFVKEVSLGHVVKQQIRFTPQQTLDILKQVTSALDYAHSQGVVHDLLSPSMLINQEQTMQIAGFGLKTIFGLYRSAQDKQIQSSSLSNNLFSLGNPAYISPERALGMPTDARSDIYALGMILFELLSGTSPFRGSNSSEISLKHPDLSIPSISTICPDIPEVFDLVISKTLEHDPEKRYQHAGDIVVAFEIILKILEAASGVITSSTRKQAQDPQITLPPTINWFDEESTLSDQRQVAPSLPTGYMSAVTALSSTVKIAQHGAAALSDTPTEVLPKQPSPIGSTPNPLADPDPFSRWSATEANLSSPRLVSRTPSKRSSVGSASSKRHSRKPAQQGRRKAVSMLATAAAAVTVSVFAVEGVNAIRFMQSMHQSQSPIANAPVTGLTSTTATTNTNTKGSTPTAQATTGTQQTPTPSNSSTAQPSSTPQSAAPTQAPPPPSSTGILIGDTLQATNSAISFTNPADGQGCLLIRLPNGNFVATERACTDQGIAVNYNSSNQTLVCPAHGAVFNPSSGCSHVSGPGSGSLKVISIRVNADGTITTG